MTDKVQKIREEVVRMHNLLPVMDGDNISVNYADRICTTLEMYIDSLQKEPVSEDLEKAALMHFKDVMEYENKNGLKMANTTSFKAGANWQKEQILDCNTTLQRTFELGKQEMKQQMMENAVDAVVKIDAGGYPYVDRTIELYDYDKDIPLAKRGDKVKVIVIKED